MKSLATLFILMMGLFIAGFNAAGSAAAVALVFGAIAVLLLSGFRRRGPGRPAQRPHSRRLEKQAATLSFYRGDPIAVLVALIVGQAMWGVREALEVDDGHAAVSVGVLFGAGLLLMAVGEPLRDATAGTIGLSALSYQLLASGPCREALGTNESYGLVIAIAAMTGLSVGTRMVATRRGPALRSAPAGAWLLAAFAIAELIVFILTPGGLWIWGEAPPSAGWLAAALLLTIGVIGGYAPVVTYALAGAAIGIANLVLAVGQVGATTETHTCGDPIQTAAFTLCFAVLGGAVGAVRGKL